MSRFHTSRVFAAPPARVFAALSSPERLARWWGPSGFSNRFEHFDFRTGGEWRFTMHGPDGSVYPNASQFTAIEPDREVVIAHRSSPHFTLTITIRPEGEGSRVSWEQVFEDAAVAASIRHIVEPANEQNLDRWQIEVAGGRED